MHLWWLCMAVEQVAKSLLLTAYTISASMSNVSATNSAIPTSAPTHPTIWKAAGDGFDVPRNMKISSSATALSFHGDVIAIGSVDHSENSTFQGQVNVWGLKNSTTSTGTELTWSYSWSSARRCGATRLLWSVCGALGQRNGVGCWRHSAVRCVWQCRQRAGIRSGILHAGRYLAPTWRPRARSGQLLQCLWLRSCIV
jgi:hypothetical protein